MVETATAVYVVSRDRWARMRGSLPRALGGAMYQHGCENHFEFEPACELCWTDRRRDGEASPGIQPGAPPAGLPLRPPAEAAANLRRQRETQVDDLIKADGVDVRLPKASAILRRTRSYESSTPSSRRMALTSAPPKASAIFRWARSCGSSITRSRHNRRSRSQNMDSRTWTACAARPMSFGRASAPLARDYHRRLDQQCRDVVVALVRRLR